MLASTITPDGVRMTLSLHDQDYSIEIDGQPLMSTRAPGSEKALADLAARELGGIDNVLSDYDLFTFAKYADEGAYSFVAGTLIIGLNTLLLSPTESSGEIRFREEWAAISFGGASFLEDR